ncbi:hypothetical protein [Kroppenstedtia eburnea]|uniref:hypothetical protein n=1 Tax=Kroppenstedtia eburnea TaxID=714067 RepID=UPI0036D2EADB
MPLPVILETDFYLNAEQGQTHSGKDVKRQVILETDFYLNAEQGQTHSGKDVKRQWKFGFRFGAD